MRLQFNSKQLGGFNEAVKTGQDKRVQEQIQILVGAESSYKKQECQFEKIKEHLRAAVKCLYLAKEGTMPLQSQTQIDEAVRHLESISKLIK